MSDPLLSSLCSICHVNPHTYRCPRCSTLTCSLPCIKRHKQWAECDGVRDPSVYIKQKDLATPKGIDHDYNYLTSIEREIDHAERNATSRGVTLEVDVRPKQQRYEKGEMALEAAFERCGVITVKAPKGMSRSKLNGTRVTAKTRTLRWTVEWVQSDGSKTLGVCPETQPIAEAYTAHLNWLNPDRSSKRQKPNGEASGHPLPNPEVSQSSLKPPSFENVASTKLPTNSDPTIALAEASQAVPISNNHKPSVSGEPILTHSQLRKRRRKGQSERATPSPKAQVDLDSEQQLQEWRERMISKRKAEENVLEDVIETANEKERSEKEKGERDELEHSEKAPSDPAVLKSMGWCEGDDIGRRRQPNGSTLAGGANVVNVEQRVVSQNTWEKPLIAIGSTPDANIAFYLHRPSLPSRHPVLISLSPTSTLATSLTNRLVLEFPTIYVLHQRPDNKLPEGFVNEEDFFEMAKKGLIEELEEGELRDGDDEETNEDQRDLPREGEVDEKRLLKVLGNDLKGITDAL